MASGWGATRPTTSAGAFGPSRPVASPLASQPAASSPAINNALNSIINQPAAQPQAVQAPNLSNYAQSNPGLDAALAAARRRAEQLGRQEGQPNQFQQESIQNLRDRQNTSNTQQSIDVAQNAIKTSAAGAQASLDEQMARRGIGNRGGLAAREMSGLAEAAERAKAKAATDLSLAEQQRLDNLAISGNAILQAPAQLGLAQQGLTNQGLGLQMQGAGALANQSLAQQGLGLNQWQAAQNAGVQQQQLAQQQQTMQWNQLLALLGIAGQPAYGG